MNLCEGVVCDDGNPCTDKYCDYGDGKCDIDPLPGAPCEFDGLSGICIWDVCGEDLCTGVVCDDENPCTEDRCDYVDGCVYEPVSCYDEDDCTQDLCNPATGACDFTTPAEDGTWCEFDFFGVGACEAGVCVDPCDPASEQELPCPVEGFEDDMVCCPGVQGCQFFSC